MRTSATLIAAVIFGGARLVVADTPSAQEQYKPAPCSAAQLKPAEAVRIALADLKRRKQDASKLEPPTATCSVTDKGKTWFVYFQDKPVILDGCFWIRVDDRTGKVDPIYVICG